ncbi:hypothetical protein PIB30_088081, partial [Stylosanthes scabra]|nr:hypothetical protein [Stylosanthes scabra]
KSTVVKWFQWRRERLDPDVASGNIIGAEGGHGYSFMEREDVLELYQVAKPLEAHDVNFFRGTVVPRLKKL